MTRIRVAEGRSTAARGSVAAWTAVALLGAALVQGLGAFGAVDSRDLYLFFLLLALGGLVLAAARLRRAAEWRPRVGLAVVGILLLSAAAFLPTFRAEGFVALGAGWLALWLAYEVRSSGGSAARSLPFLLVAVGAVEAVYGLAQALGGVDRIGAFRHQLGTVATGTLINRNHFAAMLVMSLALTLGVVAAALSRRSRLPRGEAAARLWIALLGCGLMGLAVLLSRSRVGAVNLVLVLVFVGLLQLLRRQTAGDRGPPGIPVGVLLAVILSLGIAVGLDALARRFLELSPEHGRLAIYRDTLAMVSDRPLAGVGPGLFKWRFRPYQSVDTGHLYEHAHSDVLQSAAEWGVPAALLWWGFVVLRALRSAGTCRRAEDPEVRGTALGCAAAIVALVFHSLFDFNLQIPTNLALFGSILGIAWANEKPSADRRIPESGSAAGPHLLGVLLLAALVAAGWTVSLRWRAERASLEGGDLAGVTRASRLDPDQPRHHFRLGLAHRDIPDFRDLDAARRHLKRAVALNPYHAHYRLELAKLQELSGDRRQAEASLRTALELDPHRASIRWRLANLYLREGALSKAFTELGPALADDAELYAPALWLVLKAGGDLADVDSIWPRGRAARLALLNLLCGGGLPAAEPPPAEFLLGQLDALLKLSPPPSVAEGSRVVRHLFERDAAESAIEAWLALTAAHGLVDPAFAGGGNAVWNGGFELPLTASGLDWVGTSGPGWASARQKAVAREGRFALRVDFDGSENLNFYRLLQEVAVEGGREYELAASLRTEELSTERGIFIEILSQPDSSLLLATEPMTGSTPWREVRGVFQVPQSSRSIVLRLRRQPSRRIEGRLSGRLWIDGVSLATR